MTWIPAWGRPVGKPARGALGNFKFPRNDKKLPKHGDFRIFAPRQLTLLPRNVQVVFEPFETDAYQVACSDEGLMSYEIEDCLKPVIKAVKRAGGEQAKQWAAEMIKADEGGFICDAELGKLVESKS